MMSSEALKVWTEQTEHISQTRWVLSPLQTDLVLQGEVELINYYPLGR